MTSLIENLARIKTTFDDIKNAILSKGVAAGDTVDTYADAIMRIQTGTDVSDTTATASDVVKGKVFHTSDGASEEGTLPELKEISGGWAGDTYNWTNQTKSYVPNGKNFKIATLESVTGGVKHATTSDQTIVAANTKGYFPSAITLSKLSQTNLTAANILKGTTVAVNNGSTDVWKINGSASRCKYGTVTTTASSSSKVTLGWKPSYVFVFRNRSTSYTMANMYYNGTYLNVTTGQSSSSTTANITVQSDGFTLASQGTYYGTCYYVAIE